MTEVKCIVGYLPTAIDDISGEGNNLLTGGNNPDTTIEVMCDLIPEQPDTTPASFPLCFLLFSSKNKKIKMLSLVPNPHSVNLSLIVSPYECITPPTHTHTNSISSCHLCEDCLHPSLTPNTTTLWVDAAFVYFCFLSEKSRGVR